MNKQGIGWVVLAFFVVTVVIRLVPHGYNFTPVAAFALFVGCYLSVGVGIALTLGAMVLSDLLGHFLGIPSMGFYNLATTLTVYFALGLTALIGRGLRGRVHVGTVPLASMIGTILFFLTTNFACWLDPMMDYPRTLEGLTRCYVLAAPFAINTLVGDLFYSAALFGLYNWVIAPQFSADETSL